VLLQNLNIIGTAGPKDIFIKGSKIETVSPAGSGECKQVNGISLSFTNAIAFPGLINSHDHLDFNLFPQIRNKIYNNYIEWGNDIHTNNKNEIDRVLKIPQALRVKWGMYKNLLNGITTVVNHGLQLEIEKEFITVFQDCYSLHSAGFEKLWKWKLNHPFADSIPFVIHAGEGTDEISNEEINVIARWNLFKRKLIAVHGVAMNIKQVKSFKALIWCPASNYFLVDKTANIDQFKNEVDIVFGTDSTLTANWNLWDHLRLARNENAVIDEDIIDMLTTVPALLWHFENCGKIAAGNIADIVIANANSNMNDLDNFFALNPEDLLLITHNGNIRLFDESLYVQLPANSFVHNFSKIIINGKIKYVEGDLPGLMNEIKKYNPGVQFPFSCW
jgi:cytosine/adenosine deaminase-related metal-dependent hydrolase